MTDFYVRTQYDGKDYLSVFEIYYFDEEGEERIHEEATVAAQGGITCADLGDEALDSIRYQVEEALRKRGIPFESVEVEPGDG